MNLKKLFKSIWPVFLVVVLAGTAVAYETLVYTEQGGSRGVVASGGSFDIESGGEIDVEAGGALKLAGTSITSTAAELNKLDNVTATTAELNFLDLTTGAGTVEASKAVVTDGSNQIDTIDITGALKFNGDAELQCVSANVAAASVATLNATPVSLVAAVGADVALIPMTVFVEYDFNSAAYDDVGAGEDIQIGYSGGATFITVETTGFVDQTSSELRYYELGGATEFTPVANTALEIRIASGEIFSAAGDSDLNLTLCYKSADITPNS